VFLLTLIYSPEKKYISSNIKALLKEGKPWKEAVSTALDIRKNAIKGHEVVQVQYE